MFNLAPTGLDRRQRVSRERHSELLKQINDAVQECVPESAEYVFTDEDEAARNLIRVLDTLFCHGFTQPPKSYWCFVREFMPKTEQQNLELDWRVHTERALSIAWIKNSLNQRSLQFQMLSFMTSPGRLAKYYDKNACIRNIPVFKKITVAVGDLNTINFDIQNRAVRMAESVPVAEIPDDELMAPVLQPLPSSSSVNRMFEKCHPSTIILSASLQLPDDPMNMRQIMEASRELPTVNVPQRALEPLVINARDQSSMLDDIVKSYRSQVSNHKSNDSSSSDDESLTTRRLRLKKRTGQRRHHANDRDDDASSATYSATSTDDESRRVADLTITEDNCDHEPEVNARVRGRECLNETAAGPELQTEDLVEEPEEPADLSNQTIEAPEDHNTSLAPSIPDVDGVVKLSSGEIIQMAISVFRENVECFQKLFSVFVDHAVGHPKLRYLLLTDLNVYLLSVTKADPTADTTMSSSPGTLAMESCSVGSAKSIHDEFADCSQVIYKAEVVFPLEEIDCLSLGVDSQSVCFHTRKLRFISDADHEQKQYIVESGSAALGECIAETVKQIVKEHTTRHYELEISRGPTILSIILQNFIRRELNMSSVLIRHSALVYWQQSNADLAMSSQPLESYLFVRNYNPKAWRQKLNNWSHRYFVLRGAMLYQFTDSTCKTAELSINLREKLTEVVKVDLKGDEQFVAEMRFHEGPHLQMSFQSESELTKWSTTMIMALSSPSSDTLEPVACSVVLSEATILLIQEGANCAADGFMRLLLKLPLRDISGISRIGLVNHQMLVLSRVSAAAEVLFFRNYNELSRICDTFENTWQLHIEDMGSREVPTDSELSRLVRRYTQIRDFWSAYP